MKRKHPLAKRYKIENVAGHLITVVVTDDIEDEFLQQHFDNAFSSGDFEYCQAIKIEADKRKIQILIP